MIEILLMVDGFMKPVSISPSLYSRGSLEIVLKDKSLYVATSGHLHYPEDISKHKILRFIATGTKRHFEGKDLAVFEADGFFKNI